MSWMSDSPSRLEQRWSASSSCSTPPPPSPSPPAYGTSHASILSQACAGAFRTVYRARIDGAMWGLVAVSCYTSSLEPLYTTTSMATPNTSHARRDSQACAGAFGTVYRARMDGAGEVAVKVVQFGVHTKRQLAAFVNEVAVLHDTRHPHIVLMLGAYLGQQHMYMVQELLHSDLYCALGCKEQQAALRWGARCASRAGRALHVGTCCAFVALLGHLHVLRPVRATDACSSQHCPSSPPGSAASAQCRCRRLGLPMAAADT